MSRLSLRSPRSASCTRCVHQASRQASTSATPSANITRLARLESKALLRLDGPDSLNLLQGLITANALLLKEREGPLYSAILNAPGRVMLDVFIHKLLGPNGKESILIEHDKSLTTQLVQHLKRHILRSKVKLSSATEELGVFAAWSPLANLELSDNQLKSANGHPDPRLESMGYRFLSAKTSPDLEAMEASELAYQLHRTRLGVPEGPQDMPPGVALPMESNIDYMGGIDLQKGCYVGQELTSRTHHTGVIRKRIVPVHFFKEPENPPTSLLPVTFDSPEPVVADPALLPAPQSDIRPFHSSVAKPRPSGKMGSSIWCTSAGQSAQIGLGLALVRLEQMSPESGMDAIFRVGDEGWLAKAFDVEWWARKAESIQSGKQR